MAPRTIRAIRSEDVAVLEKPRDAPKRMTVTVTATATSSAAAETIKYDALNDFLRKALLSDHEAFPQFAAEDFKPKLNELKARKYLMGLKTRNMAAVATIGNAVGVSRAGGAYSPEDITELWKALMTKVPVEELKTPQPKADEAIEVPAPQLTKTPSGKAYTIEHFVATVMNTDAPDAELLAKYVKNLTAKREKYLAALFRSEKVSKNSEKLDLINLFSSNYAMHVVREPRMSKAEYQKPNVLTGAQLDAILGLIVKELPAV
jgi:tellurite resistance protein